MSSRLRVRWPPTAALLLLLLATLGPLVDAVSGGRLVGSPVDTLAAALAGYLVGAWLPSGAAAAGSLGGAVALTAANQLVDGRYSFAYDLFFFTLLVGGTALAGALLTRRRRQVRELVRLTRLRVEQHGRQVKAARLEERLRLETQATQAVMQRLGAVVVAAAGVRCEPEPEPARARASVAQLEQSSRAVLDELRRTVGSLRAPVDDPPATPGTATPPVPAGLGRYDVLVACSGLPLAVELVAGSSSPLAAALGGVAVGVPLLVRRTRPVWAAAGVAAVATATSALLIPLSGTVSILLPASVAAYAVGAHGRGWGRVAGTASLIAGGAALSVVGRAPDTGGSVVPTLAWLAVAVTSGVLAARAAARAAALAELLALTEAGRGSELRLALAEQRQVVARDLHDGVASTMTVVCLHAQAVQRHWSDPATVEAALATIEEASREAMSRLRSGLAVLEEDETDLEAEIPSFAAWLGVTVSVRQSGRLEPRERDVIRRIVREALVNVSRHAPGADAEVHLSAGADQVRVEVTNAPGHGGGHTGGSSTGLLGLGELVDLHGGRLEQGPTEDGGFRVAAWLPVVAAVPA